MYKNFFGFKESPFKLVPNPAYLFLSRSHEEALAHLTYAINHGDGFVLITGEVGTGKTTLCRAFLDQLEDTTEAAYIFNPKLNSLQLLKTINDEFGIDSNGENIKDLIDTLNTFLMEKKAIGKTVILLIDEAQNLTKPVLEQLRLLSNLETNVSKLLQIILVGQPELGEMITSYELRQLGQRITLGCVLLPLNFRECREYIRHRIHVASQGPAIRFTKGAFRAIYNYSRGIPRRINMVCDRALLTAYSLNRHRVTGSIARSAVKELTDWRYGKHIRISKQMAGAAIFLILSVIFVLAVFHPPVFVNSFTQPSAQARKETAPASQLPDINSVSPTLSSTAPETSKETDTQVNTVVNSPDDSFKPAVQRLPEYLKQKAVVTPRKKALETVLNMWSVEPVLDSHLDIIENDPEFFQIAARQNGFLTTRIHCNLPLIKQLNLPAILSLKTAGGDFVGYLTLAGIDHNTAILIGDKEDRIRASEAEIGSFCADRAYIVWRNFYGCKGAIPINSTSDSIRILKQILKDIGVNNIGIDPVYNPATENAVKALQQTHQLPVDGIVGDLTKIALYNEIKSLNIPHLIESH